MAAAGVFADKGLAGATVDDLTTAAGFTRGAFYSNFSSKEEVFDLAVTHLLERILSTARTRAAQVDIGGDIYADVDALISSVRAEAQLLSRIELEGCLNALRHKELRDAYLRMRTALREQVAAIITESVEEHGKQLLIDPIDLADAVIALYINDINLTEIEGRKLPTSVLVTNLINAVSDDPINLAAATAKHATSRRR
ncbi:hypothetical protein BSZ39_03995 [Bowdeniella nasicola]|uniref:HTH tetR-type domain-containing protein n=1 Tax=Bowdeniella nasicola TaxID=208480 RepID=A0A1Q5Q488_9ACTO|nr:TetR/AcrR family transcriptional regulator [Bowdeniella nasicola]OKL54470.1 hypothetical protein BSZ39_03995 [Bowdeniella nasicola]